MMITCIYSCMLITNWGSPSFDNTTFDAYKPSLEAFWIKIIVAWISALIYIWTLIAPRCCKNKNFG